jgi:antitoxin component of MazEF toxin-antitoxin module
MSDSARKLNFMISEEVAAELEKLVPAGKRSRVVNEAIRKELERLRRESLTERLHVLRESGPLYKASEIEADLRQDRSREE